MKKKIGNWLLPVLLLALSGVAASAGRNVAIDDLNPASYTNNGYVWGTPTLGSITQNLNFTMRIGATTIGSSGTSTFRVFEDGYVVLGSGAIGDPNVGLNYSAGANLTDIQGAGGQPLFVIAPFYSSLTATRTAGTGTYQNGELSSNVAEVAGYLVNPPAVPPATGVPPPYLDSDKQPARWGKASWYGLTGADPGTFFGQIELRDFGDAVDGDFDFRIRFEGFASADFPSVGAGLGGFSLGGVKYLFDAADVIASGGAAGGISAGNVFTDFQVRGGVITGFGTNSSGDAISRVFVGIDDPGTGNVPTPSVLLLLAAGGLLALRGRSKSNCQNSI